MSALDPDGKDREKGWEERRQYQPTLFALDEHGIAELTAQETLENTLNGPALNGTKEHGARDRDRVDPIWTWNAPHFLTGESHGSRRDIDPQKAQEREPLAAQDTSDALTLKEKVQNVKDYFASLEDYERRKGGRTHYRIILSFDVPATNRQIRDLTNKFLEQAFPMAIAFGAIHRDTEHPHVHLYLNSRQVDGKRIQLKNNEFKTIDEKWARIYSDFAGAKSVYVEHLRKKEETRQWKIAAAEAYRKGEPIPPRPERDADRRDGLGERRLSAERSNARDQGKTIGLRPPAEPVSRPASEKETARFLAREEVAREELAHLIRTDAPDKEIKWAARTAHELTAALDKTRGARKEMGRERMPQIVYTTQEWKQLKEFAVSRYLPVKDDRAAARLQSGRVIAGAELKDAQGKAEAFQSSRHFWKFEVEGWDRGLSLKEVEQAIKTKSEERLKLYNFLRPSKREMIRGQIDYLQEVKKDIQKQLATKELAISKNLGAAQTRFQVATKQVEQGRHARSAYGKQLPAPVFHKEELARMEAIASRNKDGHLLTYVYEQVRDKVADSPSLRALSRAKGRSVMARLEMLKQADRFKAAVQFGDFRQLPRKDEQGRDHTNSIREISPKHALETIIRHFTDTPQRKRERSQLTDIASQQARQAEDMSTRARDYSVAVDRILDEFCRAAGVSAKQVAPALSVEEIAGLRDFSENQPLFTSARREFLEAARLAEHRLDNIHAARVSREARSESLPNRPEGQSRSESIPSSQRTDRDTFSRGR